ncbi:hypothetical protein [Nocardioides speluncae]|uniref:hypothetical protein n=1 Tax=Nocardioides speluncae TaxID=2670337 RepID=UPI000D6985A3|nr:hypothetical protein [Nocardioides speluncae]
METYSLWNGVLDDKAVLLYATAINVQELGAGTAKFIETVLSDYGLPDEASDWSISEPFATSYLCQDDESTEWRDRWWLTWDIRIELATNEPVHLPDRLVDTFAYDDSWSGEEASPEALVVIAEAPDSARAKELKADLTAGVAKKLGARRARRAQVANSRSPGLIEVRVEPGRRPISDAVATADLVEQLARSLGADTRLRPG